MKGKALRSTLRCAAAVPFAALRTAVTDPQLVRLQLSWAAVMVASWTATVALSVVAYAEDGSSAVALAVLARTVPGVFTGPVVGAIVDRYPRKRCLLLASLLCAFGTAGAALAAGSLVVTVVLVTAVALVTMLFRTAHSAVLPELVGDLAELTAANVMSSSVESLGLFVGPALAAGLLAFQGPELAFACSAGLFAAAGLFILRLEGGRALPPVAQGGERQQGGARKLLRLRAARLVLALALAQTVLSGALLTLYPALAVDTLNLEVGEVGLLTAAFGLGGVVGSLGLFALAGSRHLGFLSCLSLLLWSLPLLLFPLEPALPYALMLLVVVGGGNVLFDVTSVTLLQRGVMVRLHGRAFGALETVVVIGLGVGAAAAPMLEGLVGPAGALAVLAAPLVVVALGAVHALCQLDRELTDPVRQVEMLRRLAPFALLPPMQLERLALRLRRVEVAAGATPARQGEPGDTWFLVDEGRLSVVVDGQQVRELGPGEGFGEIALLRAGLRTATVTATTPTVLWFLEGSVFLAALLTDGGRTLAALDAAAQQNLQQAPPSGRHSP